MKYSMMHFLTAVSGCKINVNNILQLKIALDCVVSVVWSYLFVAICFAHVHVLSTYMYCT